MSIRQTILTSFIAPFLQDWLFLEVDYETKHASQKTRPFKKFSLYSFLFFECLSFLKSIALSFACFPQKYHFCLSFLKSIALIFACFPQKYHFCLSFLKSIAFIFACFLYLGYPLYPLVCVFVRAGGF